MKKTLFILILITGIIVAQNTSFQKSQTEYFKDIQVVKVRNLLGDLRLAGGYEDVQLQSVVFFDAGELEESKRFVNSSEVKVLKKSDTLIVTVLLPIDKLDKIKYPEFGNLFTGSSNYKYQGKKLKVSANKGISFRTDLKIGVPDYVDVIADVKTGRIFLDRVNFYIKFRGDRVSINGEIIENGETHFQSSRAKFDITECRGFLSTKCSEYLNFQSEKDLSGRFYLKTSEGDINFDVEDPPGYLDINLDKGKFVYRGFCPDSSVFRMRDVASKIDIIEGGDMHYTSLEGDIDLYAKKGSFDRIDAAIMEGKLEYNLPDSFKVEGDDKKFQATLPGKIERRLFLRMKDGKVSINIYGE